MTQTLRSPLARLALFMICLSVAGTILASGHYLTVDLPQHQNVQAPANYGYCNEMIINAMHHACPRTDCDLCVTIAETKLECQVSTSDKIAICGPTG